MIDNNPSIQPIPVTVLRYWFGPESIDLAARVGGGFSGDLVYRIRINGQTWGLKRHSGQYSAMRMSEVGKVIQSARENPELRLPAPRVPSEPSLFGNAGWAEIDSRIWSCWEWCEGETPAKSQLTDSLARQLVQWVANFHSTIRELSTASGPAPTIRDRYFRAKQLDEIFQNGFAKVIDNTLQIETFEAEHRNAIQLASQTLQRVWRGSFHDLVRQARSWGTRELRLQYVLRDVHHRNMIVRKGQLATMIDIDAVRIDTPATDIARMAGDWLLECNNPGEAEQTLNLFIDAYRSQLLLSPTEEALVRWLVKINPLVNLGNWLVWLTIERRDFGDSTSLAYSRLRDWTRMVAFARGVR